MKSRPLKVGEYRKVKTWDELLATEGAEKYDTYIRVNGYAFSDEMIVFCDHTIKLTGLWSADTHKFSAECNAHFWVAEFFTDDYYYENGNPLKPPLPMEGMKLRAIDPLDTIETKANQTLDQISKLREIDLKQAEIDELIQAQNKRISEYEKGA